MSLAHNEMMAMQWEHCNAFHLQIRIFLKS